MKDQPNKLLLPMRGMMLGMALGIFLGIVAIWYFEVETLLDQMCVVGSSFMMFQLIGAAAGSTIGKSRT